MHINQEPKYKAENGQLVNRNSLEAIPDDEPVFVFRARDKLAVRALQAYATEVALGAFHAGLAQGPDTNLASHALAVGQRIEDFRRFAAKHPERMKQPDTATVPSIAAVAVAVAPAVPGLTRTKLLAIAAKAGFSEAPVRAAFQALYERGYISYPMTDCGYLPTVLCGESPSILADIKKATPEANTDCSPTMDAPIFSDEPDVHHAIIPCEESTLWRKSIDDVAPLARAVYLIVVEHYVKAISTLS